MTDNQDSLMFFILFDYFFAVFVELQDESDDGRSL